MRVPAAEPAAARRIGELGRHTLFGTGGLALRAVIQLGYLIALTRYLGAAAFGEFTAAVATAVVAAPLVGWGVVQLYVERVAGGRGRDGAWWAAVLLQSVGSGLVLVAVAGFAAAAAGSDALLPLLQVALAELVALPLANATATALLTAGRAGLAALAVLLVPAARLAALLFLLATQAPAFERVALAHCLASVAGLGLALLLLRSGAGVRPQWPARPRLRETLAGGTPYALGALAALSYTEVDKVIMLHLLGAQVVGEYTPAFRLAALFALPIAALLAAALPRLFAAGGASAPASRRRIIVAAALAYAVLAALAMAFAAPWLPAVLGKAFAATPAYALVLCLWLPLTALHQAYATLLTAAGRQAWRAAVEGGGLAAVVLLNLLLQPRHGALGAVYALLLTEAALAAACAVAARRAVR
jgi:O-antigen/teichoic acid export membrane protein